MYPEIIIFWTPYLIDHITPFVGLVLLIILLYKITKSQDLRFRDIISKLPIIIIISLLCAAYTNFVFQSGYLFPASWQQVLSLFLFSVSSIDFVWLLVGVFISSMIAIRQMPLKIRHQRWYVMTLTYISILIPLWVLYTLGDSVIGKLNEWFFSIWSFVWQSRIAQLGGSVYPIGLLISAWSTLCVIAARYLRRIYHNRAWYRLCSLFLLGYVVILHYQHYPRHLIMSLWWFQMDLRSYICIAIACITWYFWYKGNSAKSHDLFKK